MLYCCACLWFLFCFFFFSSRRRHTRLQGDWSSDVCSSDLEPCDGGSDGAYPTVSVAIGSGNVLYGTTAAGGSGPCDWGCGTAFQLTPPASPGGDWTETVIYSFINPNGIFSSNAGASGLAIGSGGVLYGTLVLPGPMLDNPNPCGIVFSLTPPASPGSAW